MQANEITLMAADTILVAQYHIQEMGLIVDESPTHISHIQTESVCIGHMFNRIISLVWDCFMVCGLKQFNVSLDLHHFPIQLRLIGLFLLFFVVVVVCSNWTGMMDHISINYGDNFKNLMPSTKMLFVKSRNIASIKKTRH